MEGIVPFLTFLFLVLSSQLSTMGLLYQFRLVRNDIALIMFHSARLKLTAWYLLIIVIITMVFSVIIYQFISQEVERSLQMQEVRQLRAEIEEGLAPPLFPPPLDPQLLEEAENRIKLMLAGIDILIFCLSGIAGYFLAGRTLRPIQVMV